MRSIQFLALLAVTVIISACTNSETAQRPQETTTELQTAVRETTETSNSPQPQSTPIPFQEMTIPYLRAKTFESQLGDLRLYQDAANYTSYLTSYPSENGERINALLTRPKGNPPTGGWPAVVFVHGYIPPASYQTTTRYIDHVDFLARNGFVVFKIDLRGHGNSEGEAGGGYYSDDYVQDTLYARAALQNSDFVKENGVGLWGHSMAGNVTMRALASKPEIPAIVIWGGAVYTYADMREFQIQDNSYRPPASNAPSRQERQRLFDTHGNFDPNSAFWKQVAPSNYFSDINGAVQFHHAVNDDVVNVGYSRNAKKLLDAASVQTELYEYPTGGHNITGSSFNQAMQRTADFYKKHLQR